MIMQRTQEVSIAAYFLWDLNFLTQLHNQINKDGWKIENKDQKMKVNARHPWIQYGSSYGLFTC